ncbi:MAG: histidine kinase [Marinifilaceae bacterium]|jgi:sensor histidine kinase YesM|nr:histidine kinase [Marinifilaceae bacterium]
MNKLLRFIGISPIIGILCYTLLYYNQMGEIPDSDKLVSGYLTSAVFGILAGIAGMYIGKYLNNIFNWKSKYGIRFLIQVILLFSVGTILSAIYLELFVMSKTQDLTYSQFWLIYKDEVFKSMLILFFFVLLYSIVDFVIYSFQQLKQEEIRSVEHINNQLNLQFEALRSQLSPHYLFNSLNTISSLLYIDQDKADRFIRKFCQTYQFIFKQNDKALIKLKKEINFIKAYNYLLEVRFEDAYLLKIEIDDSILDSFIPPLSIQMLVENAIKHNLITPSSPLNVNIYYEDEYIYIKNNINSLKENQPESFQIGIENIKKRYSYFTQKEIKLKKDDNFIVGLPILKENTRQKSIYISI